jgi:hypothetical protein
MILCPQLGFEVIERACEACRLCEKTPQGAPSPHDGKRCACGAMFTPGSNRQARCPECSKRHRAVKNAGYQAAHRQRQKEGSPTSEKERP